MFKKEKISFLNYRPWSVKLSQLNLRIVAITFKNEVFVEIRHGRIILRCIAFIKGFR